MLKTFSLYADTSVYWSVSSYRLQTRITIGYMHYVIWVQSIKTIRLQAWHSNVLRSTAFSLAATSNSLTNFNAY